MKKDIYVYESKLLSELRLVVEHGAPCELNDERIAMAVTLNSNLESLGFRLAPEDLATLAASTALEGFWEQFQALVPSVEADPMYPGFPRQVMAMTEAEFRFHQYVHYFSTYGLEALFGGHVRKGWLPDVERPERTAEAETLLPAKVVEVISEEEMYVRPFLTILARKARMSIPEREIVRACLEHTGADFPVPDGGVPFKENLAPLVQEVITSSGLTPDEKAVAIRKVCQHSGDLLKALRFFLGRRGWHLTTGQKRAFVRAFEAFDARDFRENLYYSIVRGEATVRMLEYLSFNKLSRSNDHRRAVADLRSGALTSWFGACERNLKDGDLSVLAQRPGVMLRRLNELLGKGFAKEQLARALEANAAALSAHTLVSVLSTFGVPAPDKWTDDRRHDVASILLGALRRKLSESMDTPFKGKKVYVDPGLVNLERSVYAKDEEGGYVRAGMAFNIPKSVKSLRFFTYWNDEDRVDLDLHAEGETKDHEPVHIGWNGDYFIDHAAVYSGDITHSDAAEYVDVDMDESDLAFIRMRLSSYTGERFSEIETVLCGMMAVGELNAEVELYEPKNCIVSYELNANRTDFHIGYIDVKNRVFVVNPRPDRESVTDINEFTLKTLLDVIVASQDCTVVEDPEEADFVLQFGKTEADNQVSLLDNDFFLPA